MGFFRELTEPWTLLLAASSAGVAWAVQLPTALAAGVGVAVVVARAGIATWQRRGARDSGGPAPAEVDPRSLEGRWIGRAEAAARQFDGLSESLGSGPLADSVAGMRPAVDETLDTLRRLAGRASTTGAAMSRIDPATLAAERQRLHATRAHAGDDLHEDLERSLAAVEEQQAVHDRLSAARAKLVAQVESGALGLEGLVARLVELSATADTGPLTGTTTVGELGDQLEGIRRGVVETDQATRSALGGGG